MGIYSRNGQWYIDYRVRGRRKRERIGPNKKLALDVLRKRKVEIAENKFLDIKKDQKIKFKDFANTYMENHAKPNKRSWRSSDFNYLKKLVPFFGDKFLYEITSFMVEKYKGDRAKQVSATSVNRELACLKCMFNKAINWGMATENPIKKVKLFKENNARIRFLEKEEIRNLFDECSPTLRTIVALALHTGMRKSEIQNLKWRDIDFNHGFITLEQTKNGERRMIPMNKVARESIFSIERKQQSPYIFCGSDGKPFNFRKAFETALKKARITNFRFHDLRHTFASHLVMAGIDLNTVRELMGHKSLNMTLRYSHLSPDHKSKAVSILAQKVDTFWTPKAFGDKMKKKTDVVTGLELVS